MGFSLDNYSVKILYSILSSIPKAMVLATIHSQILLTPGLEKPRETAQEAD